MSALDVRPEGHARPTLDSELTHYVCCCDEDLSSCGLDMADQPWVETESEMCVVCEDLWVTAGSCLRCGCESCA